MAKGEIVFDMNYDGPSVPLVTAYTPEVKAPLVTIPDPRPKILPGLGASWEEFKHLAFISGFHKKVWREFAFRNERGDLLIALSFCPLQVKIRRIDGTSEYARSHRNKSGKPRRKRSIQRIVFDG